MILNKYGVNFIHVYFYMKFKLKSRFKKVRFSIIVI